MERNRMKLSEIMSMDCQWNEQVPQLEARRPFGPRRVVEALG